MKTIFRHCLFAMITAGLLAVAADAQETFHNPAFEMDDEFGKAFTQARLLLRQGKLDDAVKELQASLQVRDSAVVRITLARVYLEQKKPDLARAEVQHALKLAPNYPEAKELLEHLQNGKSSGGAQ